MPNSRGDRPVRSAKQVQPAPGYVDSSTLLFDSEDEGTGSERDCYSEDEGNNEVDDKDGHVNKKLRLDVKFKASPLQPDSSCLAYYPKIYAASQKWNKLLGLPPPNPMGDAPTIHVPERDVGTPGHLSSTKPKPTLFVVFSNFRVAMSVAKSEFNHAKKTGFEDLPGEIRSRCFHSSRAASRIAMLSVLAATKLELLTRKLYEITRLDFIAHATSD